METSMKKNVRARLLESRPLDRQFNILISFGSLFNLSGSYYIYENQSSLFYKVHRRRVVEDAWRAVGAEIQDASRIYATSLIKMLQD